MGTEISDSEITLSYTDTTISWIRPSGVVEGLNCVVDSGQDIVTRKKSLPRGVIEKAELDGGYLHIVINQTGAITDYLPRYVYLIMDRKATNMLYYQAYKEVLQMDLVTVADPEYEPKVINPGLTKSYGTPNPK